MYNVSFAFNFIQPFLTITCVSLIPYSFRFSLFCFYKHYDKASDFRKVVFFIKCITGDHPALYEVVISLCRKLGEQNLVVLFQLYSCLLEVKKLSYLFANRY